MAREERREILIAELQASGNLLSANPKATWRGRWAAWLRGKPSTPTVNWLSLEENISLSKLREIVQEFPDASLHIRVKADQLSPEMRDFLVQLKRLNALTILDSLDTNDETLTWLSKVRSKEVLSFSVNGVTDALLQRLADAEVDLTQILDATNTDDPRPWRAVTNDGLRAAARFRRLYWLDAGELTDDDGFRAFKNHSALGQVRLHGASFTDASAETLASLTSLASLGLADTRLTDAGIAKAIQGRPLRGLYLRNAEVGEDSIGVIDGMASLIEVELENVPLSPQLVAALAKQPITKLHIEGDYRDADLLLLAPLAPLLSRFTLKTPNATDEGLVWLANANRLMGLRLLDTQATAATMKLLTNAKPGYVSLGGPNINASTLAEATRSVKTRAFLLGGESVDDEALQGLAPTYAVLSLSGTRVTANGLRSLKTNGTKFNVILTYPTGTPPPLTQQELDEITQTTGGLVNVSLNALRPEVFARELPKASPKPVGEAKSQ